MNLSSDRQYRQATTGMYHRTLAGVTVLHREDWEEPLVLNQALQLVWKCLEVGGSIDDITADIVDVFGNEVGQAREDVSAAFRKLAELGLIEPVEPA